MAPVSQLAAWLNLPHMAALFTLGQHVCYLFSLPSWQASLSLSAPPVYILTQSFLRDLLCSFSPVIYISQFTV